MTFQVAMRMGSSVSAASDAAGTGRGGRAAPRDQTLTDCMSSTRNQMNVTPPSTRPTIEVTRLTEATSCPAPG
nr:hypothetical protein GCM10017583_05330 [Agromyces mediolanus]